jgi:hypothetical protein
MRRPLHDAVEDHTQDLTPGDPSSRLCGVPTQPDPGLTVRADSSGTWLLRLLSPVPGMASPGQHEPGHPGAGS